MSKPKTKLSADAKRAKKARKALAPGAKPRYDTIIKLVRAVGVELHTRPARAMLRT